MKDRAYPLSFTTSLARAISVVGHPFILIPLTVAAASRSLLWGAVIAASTTVPLGAIILRNVRSGKWSDVDVSRHDQRSGLYRAGLPFILLAAVILYFLGASPGMLRGLAAAAVIFTVGLVGNRWLKISMHMMFAGFCAVAISRSFPAVATVVAAGVFLAALAWSRRYLDRHTWTEIAVGVVIGLACGFAAA